MNNLMTFKFASLLITLSHVGDNWYVEYIDEDGAPWDASDYQFLTLDEAINQVLAIIEA